MVLACYQMTLLNNFVAVMFVDKDLEWNMRSIRLPISQFLEKKY